jgi:hypothetical protein
MYEFPKCKECGRDDVELFHGVCITHFSAELRADNARLQAVVDAAVAVNAELELFNINYDGNVRSELARSIKEYQAEGSVDHDE